MQHTKNPHSIAEMEDFVLITPMIIPLANEKTPFPETGRDDGLVIAVKLKAVESVSGETLRHLPFHAQTGLEPADPEGESAQGSGWRPGLVRLTAGAGAWRSKQLPKQMEKRAEGLRKSVDMFTARPWAATKSRFFSRKAGSE